MDSQSKAEAQLISCSSQSSLLHHRAKSLNSFLLSTIERSCHLLLFQFTFMSFYFIFNFWLLSLMFYRWFWFRNILWTIDFVFLILQGQPHLQLTTSHPRWCLQNPIAESSLHLPRFLPPSVSKWSIAPPRMVSHFWYCWAKSIVNFDWTKRIIEFVAFN